MKYFQTYVCSLSLFCLNSKFPIIVLVHRNDQNVQNHRGTGSFAKFRERDGIANTSILGNGH